MTARGYVHVGPAPVDLEHLGGERIEDVTIVGDHHQATTEGRQPLLEKGDAVEVEMVGRLVEDQHLVVSGQQRSQGHSLALAAGQLTGVDRCHPGHAQPVEQRGGLPTGADCGPHGARRQQRLLGQQSHSDTPSPADHTGLGFVEARQQAQQRALAAAVQPDHSDAIAGGHGEVDACEQRPIRTGCRQVLGVDEDHGVLEK
jgi:hypothetical protein